MDKMQNLSDLLYVQAMHLYDAEAQMINGLPQMIEKASSPELIKILKLHLLESHYETKRVARVFEKMLLKYPEKKNEVIRQMFLSAWSIIDKTTDEYVIDTTLLLLIKQVNSYMLAGYKTTADLARSLKLFNIEQHLSIMLEEETEIEFKLAAYEERVLEFA